MEQNMNNHFVLLTFPAQGHINPTLQFAKNLIRAGVSQVTFVTSVSAHRRMLNKNPNSTYPSITFAPFSDGFDDGVTSRDDSEKFPSEFKRLGKKALTDLVIASGNDQSSRKVTFLIYSLLLPWVEEVARDLNVPSALLWIQPAFVFDVYYYYFNGYKQVLSENNKDPSYSVELPGLPAMTSRDLPSFILSSSPYTSALSILEELFQVLGSRDHEQTNKPRVFVNTFDTLENDALKALDDKVEFMAIGPLIPSAFLDGKDTSDTQFGADMFRDANDCSEWLNSSTEKASVIYVSFGSMAVLKRKQMEEIAKGLVETGRPFLWVVAEQQKGKKAEEEDEGGGEYLESLIERINSGKQGLIVQWCSQMEVLTNDSIGCFVSHCGWNSTLESIVAGVPMVAFPQWSDQGCNAKLIEDVWRIGIRVRESEEEGNNLMKSEELKRCIEMVMGEDQRSVEIRRNAEELRNLAKKAVGDGGSSERNIVTFLKEMDHHHHQEC